MKLQAVGLRGAADLMPQQLSGGMQRRVALARATALDPALIMYDEPFTGLDPISLAVIGQLIRDLNDALDATSIVVTHDVARVARRSSTTSTSSRTAGSWRRGRPTQVRASTAPFVHQFVHGEPDGPVPFHYPAPDYAGALLAGR